MSSPLHNKKVRISVDYEFTTYDEELDEELVCELLENEPVTEVLSLLNMSSLSWRNNRVGYNVEVEDT